MGCSPAFEFPLQPHGTFAHPQVVKLDALTLGPLLARPVCSFKAVFGARRLGPEQPVMAVEPVHHGFGNVVSDRGVEACRKHFCFLWNSC